MDRFPRHPINTFQSPHMKKNLFFLALLWTMGTSVSAQQAKHRVVFQLVTDDTLAWKGLMKHVKHLKEGWGDSLAIEVVAHGPGIAFLMTGKTTQHNAISWYKQLGVDFVACENTMKEKSIPPDAILPEARLVRMGLGEVILKQEAGWTYLKAGF